jgi:hypothetical protein
MVASANREEIGKEDDDSEYAHAGWEGTEREMVTIMDFLPWV